MSRPCSTGPKKVPPLITLPALAGCCPVVAARPSPSPASPPPPSPARRPSPPPAGGRRSAARPRAPQRPLLVTAEDYPGQLLAARVRQRRDQPRPQVIGDKHHTPEFPSPPADLALFQVPRFTRRATRCHAP